MKLICCEIEAVVEEYPANYPYEHMAYCKVCGKTWSIVDMNSDEELENVPAECEDRDCNDCILTVDEKYHIDCPYVK